VFDSRATLVLLLCLLLSCPAWAQPTALFAPGPSFAAARLGHAVETLPDGRVIAFSGHGTNFVALASAEVWSPVSNRFTTLAMRGPHDVGAVARLADGRYLVAGGSSDLGVPSISAAELYDPRTDSFTVTGSLSRARGSGAGATLASGKVLIAGSWWDPEGSFCELYDPSVGAFGQTGPLGTPRANNLVLPTRDGKAIVLGGTPVRGGAPIEQVELYDPGLNTFSALQPTLLPGETGWSITMYNGPRTPEHRMLLDGRYLMMASKPSGQTTTHTLFTLDPATKTLARFDTVPALDPGSLQGSLVVDAPRGRAYVCKLSAQAPYQLAVQVIELAKGNLSLAKGSYTCPDDFTLVYSGWTLLKDGRIFATGGAQTCENPNYCPSARTLFVTLEGQPTQFSVSGSFPSTASWVTRAGLPPSERYAAMVYDSARSRTVLFGGLSNSPEFLDDTWEWDGLGWTRRAPASSPPGRFCHAMAYDSQRRRTVVFGGQIAGGGALDDTWEWDGTDWHRMTCAVSPVARLDHAMAYDSARGRVVMFGGTSPVSHRIEGDTWEWDGTSWTEIHPATSPSARFEAAMAYDPVRGCIVMYGGGGSLDFPLAETWTFDGSNWTRLAPATSPPGLMAHSMTTDPHRKLVRVFGGTSSRVTTSALWEWNGTNWNRPFAGQATPYARYSPGWAYDSSRARTVMFGGYSGTKPGLCRDTWEWDGVAWLPRYPGSSVAPGDFPTAPAARANHAMAVDPTSQTPILFGGAGSNGELGDTWQWQTSAWTRLSPPNSPSARQWHAMAANPVSRGLVLFGGRITDAAGPNGDTWEWSSGEWTERSAAVSPPARQWHAMASDTERGGVLLFGGWNGRYLADTWLWDGAGWTPRTSELNPEPRRMHAMATDARRTRVVLFGGQDAQSRALGDTWEWDGTQWSSKQVAVAPSARASASMAYDSYSSRVLLHGGNGGSGPLSDVWAWDGTAWTQLVPGSAPQARSDSAMVLDSPSGRMLTFAGNGPNGLLGDTATLLDAPPGLRASYSPAAPVPGDLVTLTATMTGSPHAAVRWQQLFGRPIAFSTPSMSVVTFRAPAAGPIGVEVTAADSAGSRAFAQTTVLVVEGPAPPVARLALLGSDGGPAQVVRLDGSASSGWGLAYAWSLATAPAAAAAFSAAGSVAFYRASSPGSYVFRLTVTDSLGRSAGATAGLGIVASPPVARILSPASVVLRDSTGHVPDAVTTDTLRLDGSGSFDPAGGAPVSYSWTLVSAPPQSSVAAAFAGLVRTDRILRVPLNPTPSGGRLLDSGTYLFALTVTGAAGTALARAEVTVVDPNNLIPRADAGPDRSVFLTVLQTSPLTLAPTVPDPRLRPPANLRPYVTLDGRASGRSGQGPLGYAWTVLSAPAGSGPQLSEPASPLATFATALPGDYAFGLQVNDGVTTSPMDVTTIHVVVLGANAPPIAVALAREAVSGRQPLPGRALVVAAGTALVELDATRSTDRDDAPPLVYQWVQTAGQPVELVPSAVVATPQFVPPTADSYAFRLVVRDARGSVSSPVTVLIDAQTSGRSPFSFSIVASAASTTATGEGFDPTGPQVRPRSLRIVAPTTVTLSALADSEETTRAQFVWRQLEGPPVLMVSASGLAGAVSASELRPTTPRAYVFEAEARMLDDTGLFEGVTVRRRVRVLADGPGRRLPSAAFSLSANGQRKASFRAGLQSSQTTLVDPGSVVTLDGTASSDPDTPTTQLSFLWVQTGGPAVQLSNAASSITTFVVPSFNDGSSHSYSFLLFVDDGERGDPAPGSFDAVSERGLLLHEGNNWIGVPVNPSTTGEAFDAGDLLLATGSTAVARVTTAGAFEVYHPGLGTQPFAVEGNRGYLLIRPTATLVDFPGQAWGSSARQLQLNAGVNLIAYPPPVPSTAASDTLLSGTAGAWMANPDPRMAPYLPAMTAGWSLVRGRAYLVVSPRSAVLQLPAGP
jgi:hypothetical protein